MTDISNSVQAPRGWAVLDHHYNDRDLPEPFRSLGFDSNNLGASVWLNLGTGAMVGAIPTGLWKQRAKYAFYHVAPNAGQAIPMPAWTYEQPQWDGSNVNECVRLHDAAIEYFNKLND
ncbi:hypothetical protein LT337_32360 (plasmid) [Mycolicibacterium fortuitum]|uniref:hypothetical protein n=1 Tax=Mycolicibacterium conceptionense TaxID=451644 RepID=UPI003204CD4D|nr:hypothetical protein LT337_32360 [Mycolicibacterium fortuitum]